MATASSAASAWTHTHIVATCDLHANKDASACDSESPALFLSATQLRSLRLRSGELVWVRIAARADAAADDAAAVAVPVVVHVLTHRLRTLILPQQSGADVPSPSSMEVIASLPLWRQWHDGVHASPLPSPTCPLQVELSPRGFDFLSLPPADQLVVRPVFVAEAAAPAMPPPRSFLRSPEFLQVLPSLFTGRAVAPGTRMAHEMLRDTHGIVWVEVMQATVASQEADATALQAFRLTTRTAIQFEQHAAVEAASHAVATTLPTSFPSAPEGWLRRVRSRCYGHEGVLGELVQSMWHSVHQWMREQQDARGGVGVAQLRRASSYSPRTFLFHGLSGTGKTHLARVLAGTSGLPWVFVSAPGLFRREEGSSEAELVRHFQCVRDAGQAAFIVLDELDAILPRPPMHASEPGGGGGEDGALIEQGGEGWRMGNSRIEWRLAGVLKELLRELNSSPTSAPVFVLLTSSNPRALSAPGVALRTSPFVDREIELRALAGPGERMQGLEQAMARFVFEEEEKEQAVAAAAGAGGADVLQRKAAVRARVLKRMSEQMHGFVGADLEGFVRETLLAAITRCKREHLRQLQLTGQDTSTALTSFTPSHVRIARADWQGVLEWFRPSNLQQLEFRLPQDSSAITTSSSSKGADDADDGDANSSIDHRQLVDALLPLPFSSLASHFASLAGLDAALESLYYSFLLPLRQPALYSRWKKHLGMRASKGVLLYGPSGCGKSALAVALARSTGLNTMVVPSTSLVSKEVGSGERALGKVFDQARASAPVLLVLDQVEQLAPVRKGIMDRDGGENQAGGHDPDAYERLLSVLLVELDGAFNHGSTASNAAAASGGADELPEHQVYILATSTRPDQIDPALLRPGRLDAHIHLGLPNLRAREQILALAARDTPMHVQCEHEEESSGSSGSSMNKRRVLVPRALGLVWATKLSPAERERITECEWEHTLASTNPQEGGDGGASSSATTTDGAAGDEPHELKCFFLHLLALATEGFSGASLQALVREAAMHALRVSGLRAHSVGSWSDVWVGAMRHAARAQAGDTQREFHPFGLRVGGGGQLFSWDSTASASTSSSTSTSISAASSFSPLPRASAAPAGSAPLFSKKFAAEEVVARNMTLNNKFTIGSPTRTASVGAAAAAAAGVAPVTPAKVSFGNTAATDAATAAATAPFSVDDSKPFVFNALATADVPTTSAPSFSVPFSFSVGDFSAGATGTAAAATGGSAFSMGSAAAPPPPTSATTKQHDKDAASRHSIKSHARGDRERP